MENMSDFLTFDKNEEVLREFKNIVCNPPTEQNIQAFLRRKSQIDKWISTLDTAEYLLDNLPDVENIGGTEKDFRLWKAQLRSFVQREKRRKKEQEECVSMSEEEKEKAVQNIRTKWEYLRELRKAGLSSERLENSSLEEVIAYCAKKTS